MEIGFNRASFLVSNRYGAVTSAAVTLTVNDAAQLGSWNFAGSNWAGQQGQLPLLATNLARGAAWSTNGLLLDTNVAARLAYRDVETNGAANINCRVGSVVLWFKPDWSSVSAGGSGPGNAGRFVELGSYGSANGWWALQVDSRGTNLSFCTASNATAVTNATAAISWTNNTWHQVALTYGPDASKLYVDGVAASFNSETEVMQWPQRAARAQGMGVGSDAGGSLQIRGVLAGLQTYNYELSGGEDGDVAANYNAIWSGGGVFGAGFSSLYSSNELAAAGITGWPSAGMMVLVNSTNTNSGTWTPFSANPTVDLGTGEGLRTVNFYFQGLSGLTTRVSSRIWVDTTPPALTITAPGSNTLDRPVLQLEGYANEDLYSITYDLSNAAGLATNRDVLVLNRGWDGSQRRFRTNTFQAFDIGLTPGSNTITLHVMDWAGNQTNVSYVYVLDYSNKTNAPAVQLYWPTNGSVISGTNFTWRGSVDDPTATISAQIVDGNGDTNVVNGIVERNGNFWVENLPLAAGSNWLMLSAADACNNVTVTNIGVYQSSVGLSISYIDAITNQSTVAVQGTIGTTGYSVWVNGVKASIAGGGGWSAANVPVNGVGTSAIQARAIANSDTNGMSSGGGGTNSSLQSPGNPAVAALCIDTEAVPDKLPMIIYTEIHIRTTSTNDTFVLSPYGIESEYTSSLDWSLGGGGRTSWTKWSSENQGMIPLYGEGFEWETSVWDASGNQVTTGNSSPTEYGDYADDKYTENGTCSTAALYMPTFCAPAIGNGYLLPGGLQGSMANFESTGSVPDYAYWDNNPGDSDEGGVSDYCTTSMSYVPNGKAVPVQYVVAFTAYAFGAPSANPIPVQGGDFNSGRGNLNWSAIPPAAITMAGGQLGSDSIYYKVVSSGAAPMDITPSFDGGPERIRPCASSSRITIPTYNNAYYSFTLDATTYREDIVAIANSHSVSLHGDRPREFCAGQNVTFQMILESSPPYWLNWTHPVSSYGNWTFPGRYVNRMTARGAGASTNYDVNPALSLGCSSPSNWFTAALSSGSVAVNGRVSFPNNQSVLFSAQGSISVYKPSLMGSFPNTRASVMFNTNADGTLRLCVGDNWQSRGGMVYQASLQSHYAGRGFYTQIFYDFSTPAQFNEGCDVLDDTEIYLGADGGGWQPIQALGSSFENGVQFQTLLTQQN
jgi:hypothetical protein